MALPKHRICGPSSLLPKTSVAHSCPRPLPFQAHDYNRVVSGLDARERVLFHDRLRTLDRRVTPGLNKLTWTSDKPTLEFYFREVSGNRHSASGFCVMMFVQG